MNLQHPSLDLVAFVEQQILPRYADFDAAHNLVHVNRVIKMSLQLAKATGADLDMAYVTAAYHDLGLSGPRAVHHLTGGRILQNDARLRRWFSPEQVKIMREAVEDHRASASHAPRSIYGRIVAEADRDLDPDTVLRRTVLFGRDNYPTLDKEQHWERFLSHLDNKYSANGYIKLWIHGSENERNLSSLRHLMEDRQLLREKFEQFYRESERED